MKYYSAKTVMDMLGISASTLYKITKRGELTPSRVGGGRLRRFAEADVIAYMEAKKGVTYEIQTNQGN